MGPAGLGWRTWRTHGYFLYSFDLLFPRAHAVNTTTRVSALYRCVYRAPESESKCCRCVAASKLEIHLLSLWPGHELRRKQHAIFRAGMRAFNCKVNQQQIGHPATATEPNRRNLLLACSPVQ